jgi:hypothetical protein
VVRKKLFVVLVFNILSFFPFVLSRLYIFDVSGYFSDILCCTTVFILYYLAEKTQKAAHCLIEKNDKVLVLHHYAQIYFHYKYIIFFLFLVMQILVYYL